MRWLPILVMSVFCAYAPAQDVMRPENMPHYGQWRSSMIGGGGYIQNVVFCPSDGQRLYAYVDVGGFYRSDDGARTWRMMHGNLPNKAGKTEVRGLLVDPADADRILVACGSQWGEPMGIYASDDGGRSFTQTLKARFGGNADFRWDGFILARDPKNPAILLAGTMGDGLYRSSDGGSTWAAANDQTKEHFFTDVRFDANSPKAWACSLNWKNWLGGKQTPLSGGFFESEDGGVTWRKLSDESPREMAQEAKTGRLLGIFSGGSKIRVSDDGAKTWRDLTDGLRIDEERAKVGYANAYRYNAICAGTEFTVLASSVGDFYRLSAGDTKWQPVERESINYRGWYGGNRPDGYNMFGQALGSISIDPRDPSHWYFTDWFAIYETLDSGRNWTLRMDGVEVTVIHALCQDPADPGRVHLGMADNGYLVSRDGGSSFALRRVSGNVKDVALSPKLPARVYAAGTATHEWSSNQVFVSIDAGQTWTRSPMTGLPDMKQARCNTVAVDPDDPYHVILTVSGEVKQGVGGPYSSSDGGKTWTWIGRGLPEGEPFYPESIWSAGRQVAAGPSGGLLTVDRSSAWNYDAGAGRWSRIGGSIKAPISVVADPFVAGRFLVSADDGIYLIAGGEARKVYSARATHLAADMASKGRFAASVHDGVIVSVDSGENWTLLDAALPHALASNPVAFAGDRLVAGSGGSGVFWIPLSEQGERPALSRPVPPVPAQASKGALPVLQNLDFSAGGDTPTGWNKPWVSTGSVSVHLDTKLTHDGKRSLRLQTNEPDSYGSVGQSFKPTGGAFTIAGYARSEGQLQESSLAIQVFDAGGKQIAWLPIADLKQLPDWKRFSTQVDLPPAAAHAVLVLTIKGEGKSWLSDISLQSPLSVFR